MERGGGRESVAVDAEAATDTVSQRRVAIEVAGLAVWGEAQRRTKLTDEQVPLPISALAPALPPEQGAIGPDHRHRHREKVVCPQHHVKSAFYGTMGLILSRTLPALGACPPCGWVYVVDTVDRVDSGGRHRFWCVGNQTIPMSLALTMSSEAFFASNLAFRRIRYHLMVCSVR